MALAITAAPPVARVPTTLAPPAKAARPAGSAPVTTQSPSGGSATASTAQLSAALNQLLNTYRNDQSHGAPASILSSLGRQIMTAAQAAKQHVTLPRGSPSAGAASAPSVATPPSEAAKVNLTA